LLQLRKEMNTFGNLRPCSFASEKLVEFSPLKEEICKDTEILIVRELTGGIYFGGRKEDDGVADYAYDTEGYSRAEITRIARMGGFLCRAMNLENKKVTSLDKANVLASSRFWRKVVGQVFAKEFPDLTLEHQYIDSAAMIMVQNPKKFNGVI